SRRIVLSIMDRGTLKENSVSDTPSDPEPATQDMHWGISYLREDIQDLRTAIAVPRIG
ncbi:uncharacterized protein METZ01_LOCUS380759, partial [marine metagenome]